MLTRQPSKMKKKNNNNNTENEQINRQTDRERSWQREGEREEQYLYLTRREQKKEGQSCSRQERLKRGRRAMELWVGLGGRGGKGGMGKCVEKEKHKT